MAFRAPPKLEGYCFPVEKAKSARDSGKLLAIRLETSLMCNLHCNYCYNAAGKPAAGELKFEKLVDLVDQAKELGAESVVIIGGGEPTIYPKFRELVNHVYSSGIVPVIFTNGQAMTRELAQFLHEHNASIILKLDSLDEKLQDEMVGSKGAHKKIMLALQMLLEAGYSKFRDENKLKLGASAVASKQNAHEIPKIWRFCRDRKIFPNIETMTPSGNAREISHLLLTKTEWRKLKLELLNIDRNEYGYDWVPYTPLPACGCFQVMYSLYITSQGKVRPCAGIEAETANILDNSLAQIIDLPFFKIARNVDKHLEGKCKGCEYLSSCIGCRGLAYTIGTEAGKEPVRALCGEDPSCFK